MRICSLWYNVKIPVSWLYLFYFSGRSEKLLTLNLPKHLWRLTLPICLMVLFLSHSFDNCTKVHTWTLLFMQTWTAPTCWSALYPAVALTLSPSHWQLQALERGLFQSVSTVSYHSQFSLMCQVVRRKVGCNPDSDLIFVCYDALCVCVCVCVWYSSLAAASKSGNLNTLTRES